MNYNCLMLNVDIPNWEDLVRQLIDENDVYDNEDHEYGYEFEPHVTILYGIHNNVTISDLQRYLIPPHEVEVTMTNISVFENNEFDVVKFDIESPELVTINRELRDEIDYTETYPDYHPHMTLCYVKPGTGKKYVNDKMTPIKLLGSIYDYSIPDENTKQNIHQYLTDKDLM